MKWLIYLIAALLPTYLVRFQIGPFPTTLLEILIVILIAIWLAKSFDRDRDRDRELINERLKLWWAPLLLFLSAGIISVIVAPNHWAALGLFRAYILEPILFFIICLSILRDRHDVEKLFFALGLSALAISIYAIIQKITGIGIPATWLAERRVTSFYPFPNAVGLFLAPLIPIFLSFAVKNTLSSFHDREKMIMFSKMFFRINLKIIFWWLIIIGSILAIIFSKTEAAWIGVAAGLFFFFVVWRPTRLAAFIIAILTIITIFSIPITRRTMVEKVTLRDWSGIVRRIGWNESFAMLRDRPIFGAGLAGYPTIMKLYHRATAIEIFQYPHNIFLNFWSELGLLGLIAFIWLIIVFFKCSFRNYRLPVTGYRLLNIGLAAGLLILLIHGLVDVPYFKNDLAIEFWFIAAAVTVISTETERSLDMARDDTC